MASAYEKRPGRWYARWKSATGEWRHTPVPSAQTKTEARRAARELEERAWRQRMGLEALPPSDGGGTVASLLTWWLKTISKGSPSHSRNESAIRTHLIESHLARFRLADLTSGEIESFLLAKEREGLSAHSADHFA